MLLQVVASHPLKSHGQLAQGCLLMNTEAQVPPLSTRRLGLTLHTNKEIAGEFKPRCGVPFIASIFQRNLST